MADARKSLDQMVVDLQEAKQATKELSEQVRGAILTARENGDVQGLLEALEEHFRALSIQEALEGECLNDLVHTVHDQTRGDLEWLLGELKAGADEKFRGFNGIAASLQGAQVRVAI